MVDDISQVLRYPIGEFTPSVSPFERPLLVGEVERLPAAVRDAVADLSPEQLMTPYRPEGWTIRQLVHHLADSHINSYVRFKLALTEDLPQIKPYDEAAWAALPDVASTPVASSLKLLEALHERWTILLRAMSEADFERGFRHPELGEMTLNEALARYAWHGRHHVAQITSLRSRMNW